MWIPYLERNKVQACLAKPIQNKLWMYNKL